jgi:hypothetical protein
MSTDPTGRPRVRASDSEREQLAKILRAAMAEGRLTLDEGEERLARAYGSTYRDELDPLTTDLPDGGRTALFNTPEAQAAFRRGARSRAVAILAVGALLVGAWILSGAHFFWPLIPLMFLGFALFRRRRWYHWQAHHHGYGPPWMRGYRR